MQVPYFSADEFSNTVRRISRIIGVKPVQKKIRLFIRQKYIKCWYMYIDKIHQVYKDKTCNIVEKSNWIIVILLSNK